MQFWVYENYPNNFVAIHEENCALSNKAVVEKSDLNGKWHGPMETIGVAIDLANRLGRSVKAHSCCSIFMPGSNAKHHDTKPGIQTKPYSRFEVDQADESTLPLEELFERKLLQLYVVLRDQGGYSAIRFLNSVRRNSGVQHA